MDILLTAGERISMALLAMAVNSLGVRALAFTGQQAGLRTDSHYGKASIVGVVPERILRVIKGGGVAIVAGFQGVNDNNDVTTLGRGGSDTTAVAFAAALKADVCEIYTDVDGVFSADPRIVPGASQLSVMTYEETLELRRARRQGAPPASRRVRPQVQRAPARPFVVLQQGRHLDRGRKLQQEQGHGGPGRRRDRT